ncbi:unnamed protein product [Victoria cruziana]
MDHRPKDSSSANVCGSIVLALSLDKRSVCITEGQVRPSMFYINGRTPLQYLYLLCSLANFNLQKERERESQETAGIDACHDRSHGRRIHINLVTCNLSTMRHHQPSFAKDRHQECLLFPRNGYSARCEGRRTVLKSADERQIYHSLVDLPGSLNAVYESHQRGWCAY